MELNCRSSGLQGEQQHGHISNKKRKKIFPYRNHKSYYGYQISQEMEEDARLKVFKNERFEEKDCPDIGYNSGIMTIQIGTFLSVKIVIEICRLQPTKLEALSNGVLQRLFLGYPPDYSSSRVISPISRWHPSSLSSSRTLFLWPSLLSDAFLVFPGY
ncbi:hypothetical protein ACFX13_018937 [Malus domestica]